MQSFIDACQMMLPDGFSTGNARIGLFLFLLGASDRMWQRLNLDDSRFPPFATSLLESLGVAASAATALCAELPQLRHSAVAREALLEGAESMDIWLDGHDPNSLLRLKDLVLQWQKTSWSDLASLP
jgi:hypothetical protein